MKPWILAFLAIYAGLAAFAAASPLPFNPVSMTVRADNTQTVRGVVMAFEDNDPLGGCSFSLHHSASLDGVRVVLDATRGRVCKTIARKLAMILDPYNERLVVEAKGRVTTEPAAAGIGDQAREQLRAAVEAVDCTATRGASPSLALDPLQNVKQELDAAIKGLKADDRLAFAKTRAEIIAAQDDLEHAASLTGAEPVCNLTGVAELQALLAALPRTSQQVLHATDIELKRR